MKINNCAYEACACRTTSSAGLDSYLIHIIGLIIINIGKKQQFD